MFQQLWTPMLEKKKKQMATEIFRVVKWEAPHIVVWSLSSKYMNLKSSSYSFYYYYYYFIFFIYKIALLNYHKHFFLVLVQNLLPNVGVMKVSLFELKYKL